MQGERYLALAYSLLRCAPTAPAATKSPSSSDEFKVCNSHSLGRFPATLLKLFIYTVETSTFGRELASPPPGSLLIGESSTTCCPLAVESQTHLTVIRVHHKGLRLEILRGRQTRQENCWQLTFLAHLQHIFSCLRVCPNKGLDGVGFTVFILLSTSST